MARYGLLIDTSRCTGCYACRTACQVNNLLDPTESYIAYEHNEQGKFPNVSIRVAPRQCGHCDNAPCISVCPTGASYRAEDGTVQVDEERCIGCGYCAQVCPYQARVKRTSGVFSKCSLCHGRIDEGEQPFCVAACPARVRFFGDLDDASSEINQKIAELDAAPLGGSLTDSRLFYTR